MRLYIVHDQYAKTNYSSEFLKKPLDNYSLDLAGVHSGPPRRDQFKETL